MAIKITTPIGTDKGITSEAYVRITNYSISKFGNASFETQLFLNEADAKNISTVDNLFYLDKQASNFEIGRNVNVPLQKQVVETYMVTERQPKEVEVQVTETVINPQGEAVETTKTEKRIEMQEVQVEKTRTSTVADLSLVEGVDIFNFGYTKLKEHLSALYGAENIADC